MNSRVRAIDFLQLLVEEIGCLHVHQSMTMKWEGRREGGMERSPVRSDVGERREAEARESI